LAPTSIQLIGAGLFAIAILHTFTTGVFERLARARPAHAGLFHLLGEVEVVFGFWAMVLMLAMFAVEGADAALHYVDGLNFAEPMFVFAVMVVAGSRPILDLAMAALRLAARLLPLPGAMGFYFSVLTLVPLLGSVITEPAAMTLAALVLSECFFGRGLSTRLRYVTLGVLLVNVSIGGTLTPFAAPPVVMVAGKWGWDLPFMLATFGWKAALAAALNSALATIAFRRELAGLKGAAAALPGAAVPAVLVFIHLFFLIGIVTFAHHPPLFMGFLLFFLGVAQAYRAHQDRLILREGLLVAFFLAGLVVLGGQQRWWLQPVLLALNEDAVFWGATALTAITDNAALTYLGSLVEGLPPAFKYALVSGAVTGGGLTIIANAPNPAGIAVLRGHFKGGTVNPAGLFLAALIPTAVVAMAFRLL
jgi:hypothetical protein